jgi:predicted RNase H-like nuclease
MGAGYRLPYKVSKSNKYWPGQSVEKRIRKLVRVWQDILGRLVEHVRADLEFPKEPRSLAALKRYEDTLDALVCAWVGVEFLAGRARGMGDGVAAIWSAGSAPPPSEAHHDPC